MAILNEQAIADELAIGGLVAQFTDAVNRRAPAEHSALFAPDGVWIVPGIGETAGRDAIAALLGKLLDGFEFLVQLVHSGQVWLDGDRARGRWYISEFGRKSNGGGSQIVGVYQDALVRTGEGWRFAARRFDFLYLGQVEAGGKAFPYPDLH